MSGRVGFVGGGVMGEAMIRGLLGRGCVEAGQIVVSDPVEERRVALSERYLVATTTDNRGLAAEVDIVIIAVKPQQIDEVLNDLRGRLGQETLVLSIAAGVPIRKLVEGIGHDRVVRAIPNTPAQIGEGMAVWTATAAVSASQRERAAEILAGLGHERYVSNEDYLDMATALSGSGPAYVFLFLEALIDAGVHIGLARPLAQELVLHTILGATHMVQESGLHPAELRNQVTSPGGTTAAGLAELEAGRLRAVVDQAVRAAFARSRELGSGNFTKS